MTLNEIKLAIRNGNFKRRSNYFRFLYPKMLRLNRLRLVFEVGDEVFVVQKTKKTKGIVEKINIKKAIVTLPQGRYNVPPSMLEAV